MVCDPRGIRHAMIHGFMLVQTQHLAHCSWESKRKPFSNASLMFAVADRGIQMKNLLWRNLIIKTVILALLPVIIGILGSITVSTPSLIWFIITGIMILLYIFYLIGNCFYERTQKKHESWHDAITKLCRADCTLIKSFADSIYKMVNSKIGHAEIADWATVKNHCDIICNIVYDFIRSTALRGDEFSVSVFFKRTLNEENQYIMLSRTSYDNHNPASYNVFRTEEEVKSYYYKRLFDEARTWPAILSTKETIHSAFYNCDGVDYSQYVGIPIACLGNKMIANLQIVSYNDSLIAKNKEDIQKLVDDYLWVYANLILLADKVENAVSSFSNGSTQ